MFRKLVSNLPFSPALVGQLGFYARRLSSEQATRRLGLIFTVLAIAVQTLAIIKPPEQTIAAAPASACVFDATLAKDDTNCQACPYNSTIWAKDTNCEPTIKLASDAVNLSQDSKSATTITARPGDRIQYNLHTTNVGATGNAAAIQAKISDLLEYATVIDLGGGTFDAKTNTIRWGTATLGPSRTDARSFVVEINSVIPATPQATDNPQSYDCTLTNVYGNALNIHLSCPVGKVVENTVRQLPTTNTIIVVLFSTILLTTSIYFYARSKQLNRELRLIRRHYNVGSF